jgi:ferric-dicitrate binding protein FerR (iron transport regulator)
VTQSSDTDEFRERAGDASIAELLRSVPSRPAPSQAATERVQAAVYEAYLDSLRKRRRRRAALSIAASIVMIIVASFLFQQRSPTPVVVAHITRTAGDAKVNSSAGVTDQPVRTHETVSVPHGARLLLTLTNGIGLRLDESTRLVFESPATLRLAGGTVYVETPRDVTAHRSADLVIETAYGAVRHVGTKFEVRIAERELLRVRVREGTVLFRNSLGTNTIVKAGEQLDYEGNVATVRPGPGAASDAWAWTEVVGPRYHIEGRSLAEALDWFTNQAGMRLEFADEESRARATGIILHGDVSTLTLRQAIQAILSGSDLPYAIEESRLLVGPN